MFSFDLFPDLSNTPRNPSKTQLHQLIVAHVFELQRLFRDTPTIAIDDPDPVASLEPWWQAQSKVTLSMQTVADRMIDLLERECEVLASRFPDWRENILALMDSGFDAEGQVVFIQAGDLKVRIPAVMAMVGDQEEGSFLLYSLAGGVWYDSSRSKVAAGLWERIAKSPWRRLLSKAERNALATADGMTLVFEPTELAPHRYLMEALREYQRTGLSKVLELEVDDALREQRLRAVVCMQSVLNDVQARVAKALRRRRASRLPEWRRLLEGDDLALLQELEATVKAKQDASSELLANLSDAHQHAIDALRGYLQEHAGLSLDPAQVQLKLISDTISGQLPAKVTQRSLVSWALSGGYAGAAIDVQAVDVSLQEALTPAFLQEMIQALDLRVAFVRQLESVYEDPAHLDALRAVLDARLALANQAARFQGYPQPIFDILHKARNGELEGIQAALVHINGGEVALRDFLCLVEGDAHVLYAPGAPSGDLHLFPSLEAMSLEVGSWTIEPEGTRYLVKQCALGQRSAMAAHLGSVELMPTDWSRHSLTLSPIEAAGWPEVLDAFARRKVQGLVDDQYAVTPKWYADAAPADRQALTDLDQELKLAHADYLQITPMPGFREYARRKVRRKINGYPGNKGGPIDPDTVMVELEEGAIRTLTMTVIKGYAANFNFSDFARISSSVGQDVSHLSPQLLDGYIRSAKLGEAYIEKLRALFLDASRPEYAQQRLAHRRLYALRLRRDAFSETLEGRLQPAHAQWLASVLESFDSEEIAPACEVHELEIAHCVIEGAYLLKDAAGELEPLLYLPEVSTGGCFWTFAQLAEAWEAQKLGDYCYARTSYKQQPTMGTFIEEHLRQGDGRDMLMGSVSAGARITDFAADFEPRVQRLIEFADEDTTSVAERVSGVVVEWVTAIAGVLTLPFPPAALALGLLVAAKAAVQGAMAWYDGDRAAAMQSFLESLKETVLAVGAGPKLFSAAKRYLSTAGLVGKTATSSPLALVARHMVEELGETGTTMVLTLNDGFANEVFWLMQEEETELRCG